METSIEYVLENRESLNFKTINESVSNIEITLQNSEFIKRVCSELSNDSRKNVIALSKKLYNKLEKHQKEFDRVKSMYMFDKSFGDFKFVAGVDEVGRGPLAGPIVAASVILDLENLDDLILEINDSKKLSEKKREFLSEIIKKKAISYSIAIKDNTEIDKKGIGYCNNEVFIDACSKLSKTPQLVLSDGYLIKNFKGLNKSVIKGDTKSAAIACASIIAKVYRDNLMKEYDKIYPNYDFAQNVGYGTVKHIAALKEIGACEIHRTSFLKNIL